MPTPSPIRANSPPATAKGPPTQKTTRVATGNKSSVPSLSVFPAGDILTQGIDLSTLEPQPIHALIYGKNGVGKTTLACQWAEEGPLALVSVENAGTAGGATSVTKIKGITQYRFHHAEEVERFGIRLHDKHPFRIVVVDSGTSLDAVSLADVCKWDEPTVMNRFGKVSSDQYVERTELVRRVLRPYVDLPITVIFLANERDHNYKLQEDEKGKKKLVAAMVREVQEHSFVSADMSSGTVRWLSDCCDYLCRLYVDKEVEIKTRGVGKIGTPNYKEVEEIWETGRWVRRLLTSYHPNFAARVRSPDPDCIPVWIEGKTPRDLYLQFAAMARGEKIE